MNPWNIVHRPPTSFAAWNAAQEKCRREYAWHPSAFAVDPMCDQCQIRRRDQRSRKCWSCRKESA